MRTPIQDAEEKRLRNNANQRRDYAQLSDAEKKAPLQKKRERYAKYKSLRNDIYLHSANEVNTYDYRNEEVTINSGRVNESPRAQWFSSSNKLALVHSETRKGIIIKDSATTDFIGKLVPISAHTTGEAYYINNFFSS